MTELLRSLEDSNFSFAILEEELDAVKAAVLGISCAYTQHNQDLCEQVMQRIRELKFTHTTLVDVAISSSKLKIIRIEELQSEIAHSLVLQV